MTVTNATDQVMQATASKYYSGAIDETVRDRLWMAMLQREGRISNDMDGFDLNWDVMFSLPETTGYQEFQSHGFAQHSAYKQLQIDVRGNKVTDTLDYKQRLTNSGPQIVDLWGTKMMNLKASMAVSLGRFAFTDGSASGHENDFQGMNTFLKKVGGTCVATDRVKIPSGSYGGLTMDLATYGGAGSWSTTLGTTAGVPPNAALATDWPDGNGKCEYDFLAPKNINSTSTAWTGTATWKANSDTILRASTGWISMLTGGNAPTMYLMSGRMLREFKDHMFEKFRVIQGSSDTALALGFPGSAATEFEGTVLAQDFDCPADTAYGLNPNAMELMFCKMPEDSDMKRAGDYMTIGPSRVSGSTVYEYILMTFGNMRYRPKHFSAIYPIA